VAAVVVVEVSEVSVEEGEEPSKNFAREKGAVCVEEEEEEKAVDGRAE